MNDEHNDEDGEKPGEKPRWSFWTTVPRGTVARVFILLALLVGVIALQHRAGAIAGCANQAFTLPAPGAAGTSIGGGRLAPGHIRAHVVPPETSTR